jgi:hypothetical protein
MKLSVILPALLAANASHEQIMSVVMAYEAEVEAGKDKARERWRNWRERHPTNVSKRLPTVANDSKQLVRGDARVEDKTSNSEIEPQTKQETREREPSAFEIWYRTYPHKVQRGAAEKAFPKALELAGSVEALIAGVRRYMASKPPDRQWQNPATWLNGKGWLDAPATVVPMARAGPSQPNLSQLYATQERMENAQQIEPVETTVRYLPAANG